MTIEMPKASDLDLSAIYNGHNQHSMHRGPREAGAADRYYGRKCKPNFVYFSWQYAESEMTWEQIDEYMQGYINETPKDWN